MPRQGWAIGGVDAILVGDALALRGTGGGQVDVPLASIARLRAGYEQNKYSGKLYRMMLWTSAAPADARDDPSR